MHCSRCELSATKEKIVAALFFSRRFSPKIRVRQSCQAVSLRCVAQGVEGAWHWQCSFLETQIHQQDSLVDATRANPQSLRQPCEYDDLRDDRHMSVHCTHFVFVSLILVMSIMKLEANAGSDRSWVYTCPADLSDDEPKKELFAIRFANSDGKLF
jgi:hypothetical protein